MGSKTKAAAKAAVKPDSAALNAKQAAFVREYLVDSNGKQAAIRAGYSPHTAESMAAQLLRLLKVSQAIEAGHKEKQAETKITGKYLSDKAHDILVRCMAEEPVLDKEGHSTGVYRFDSAGALKAVDTLAKLNGVPFEAAKVAIEGKVEHSGEIAVRHCMGFGEFQESFGAGDDPEG